MESQQPKPSKKTYQSPRLHVYGDIREITQAVAKKGRSDAGMKSTTKTA